MMRGYDVFVCQPTCLLTNWKGKIIGFSSVIYLPFLKELLDNNTTTTKPEDVVYTQMVLVIKLIFYRRKELKLYAYERKKKTLVVDIYKCKFFGLFWCR